MGKTSHYKISIRKDDVSIYELSGILNFSTNCNGEAWCLQCDYMFDSQEYKEIAKQCCVVCKEIKKLNILLTQKD